MSEVSVPFSELTTLRVGGPAGELFAPAHSRQLIETALQVWGSGDEWLLLGGGSNTVMADDGFDGSVIRVVTRGVERLRAEPGDGAGIVRLRVQAGEPWDELVAHTVERGWVGIEALSGIPGSSGAAPVQNIGAYGQELSSVLVAIEFLDYLSGELHRIPATELGLGYRTSELKQGRRGVVVSIELELHEGAASGHASGETALSVPIAYAQLASALGVSLEDRVPLTELRAAVLRLRAAKGMLLSPDDPDSVSAGSFFTNPIVSDHFAASLPADAPRWPQEVELREPVVVPLDRFVPGDLAFQRTQALGETRVQKGAVKLSAAWLIEHSGVVRGFSLPGSGAAVSGKHTLALVNRGSATASDIAELARYIQSRVLSEFGVILQPEPVLVGVQV
jgi:UDP-N-acetylmuramate dehydrogenase